MTAHDGAVGDARKRHQEEAQRGSDESLTRILRTEENPFSRGTALIDTRGAVLLEDLTTVIVDEPRDDGRRVCAVEMSGRVNRSSARSRVLYLTDAAGAAHLAADLVSLYGRAGGELASEFMTVFDAQLAAGLRKPGEAPRGEPV